MCCMVERLIWMLGLGAAVPLAGVLASPWHLIAAVSVFTLSMWAFRRACPTSAELPVTRIIRLEADRLTVFQEADDLSSLRAVFCLQPRLMPRVIALDTISAIRITPGYMAIYLKPAHWAVDVWFPEQETSRLIHLLAPLADRFVDAVPR